MWSPSCSTPKCILALTDPSAGNKYGPLTVLSGLVYIDTVHETVKRNASANSRTAQPRSLAPIVRLPANNRRDELHGCTFLLRTYSGYSRRRNTDGTRRPRRILSRRRRGMARHELIRECVRIVEKQCITPDNKQIEAGQEEEREKGRERERATSYPMGHHASMRRAANTPLIRVHGSVYGFLQPLLIQFLRGLICSRNAGVRVCMCTVHIELWRGDDSKLSNEIASGTSNC
ncbi:hypothetical protein G5I_03044 [Acromyrmex echinatior]|uniref:Uncharacterized protein n=1 Tax=Acromyrmex echinatior TaxID=103372 RepID=F4WBX3_ACREC|nr:hypothetical protein G5I_03044 [Acromyrmex echinatior]